MRLAAAALAALLAAPAARAEVHLVAEDSSGQLPLEGERHLRIEGARGMVRVMGGEADSLQFLSTAPGNAERELPVRILSDGSTLSIVAPEGQEGVARDLWVGVPEDFDVRLAVLERVKVVLAELRATVSASGSDLEVVGAGVGGRLSLDIERGSVDLRDVAGDLRLEGSGLDTTLRGIEGEVDLDLSESSLRVTGVTGDLSATLRETKAAIGGVTGGVSLDVDGGGLEMEGLEGGGEIRLSGTPASLRRSTGAVVIETDAEVRLEEVGSLQIRGAGAAVRGTGIHGALVIVTSGAAVNLDLLDGGPFRIEGEGLDVKLARLRGETDLALVDSTVEIDGAAAEVRARCDYGKVTVREAAAGVKVAGRRADVTVRNARGAVEVDVEAGEIDVFWDYIPSGKDSSLRTGDGGVTVTLPSQGGFRIDARSRSGRVESDHPGVQVSDDGAQASGPGSRGGSAIRIDADGDVLLLSAPAGDGGP